jgi:hypothetical protein
MTNAMPARQLRLPIASGICRPTFQLSAAGWVRLEGAYKHAIPEEVRERIQSTTNDYLQLAQMEQEAAPLTLASHEIAVAHNATRNLIERLQSIQGCESDVHSFVGHLISQRLNLPNRSPFSDHLAGLIGDLEQLSSVLAEIDSNEAYALVVADAETTNAETESDADASVSRTIRKKFISKDSEAYRAYETKAAVLRAADPQQEGNAWRGWVRRLVAILEEARPRLPAGTSKVPDYPLYRLVNALRTELANENISARFPGALADAIYEAVRG